MIKIKIGDKSYDIPDTIYVEDWIKISKIGIEDRINWPRIISIIFKNDSKLLEDTPDETIELIMGLLMPLLNKRSETKVEDFEKMSFGEFVDLEVYLSLGYVNHLKDMMKIISPYSNTACKALYAFEKWYEWRSHIYRQYRGLFSNDDELDDRPVKNIDKMSIAKNWYKVIVELAGDDVLKMEEIENQPYRKILNFMSYRKEKMKKEEMEFKKKQREMELKSRRR